jgi:hypothetical protein
MPALENGSRVPSTVYAAAAAATLIVHLAWVLFVIFGALLTRERPRLAGVHLIALLWGMAVEVGPWACPLTTLEQYLQDRAGMGAYSDPFLVHYLERVVYPSVSPALLAGAAVAVCGLNLVVYVRRAVGRRRGTQAAG